MSEPRVEFTKDNKREWRWRVVAANNEILAVSSEGYKRRRDAVQGLTLTFFIVARDAIISYGDTLPKTTRI